MACFREAKKRGRAGASAVGAGRMGIAIDRGPRKTLRTTLRTL